MMLQTENLFPLRRDPQKKFWSLVSKTKLKRIKFMYTKRPIVRQNKTLFFQDNCATDHPI